MLIKFKMFTEYPKNSYRLSGVKNITKDPSRRSVRLVTIKKVLLYDILFATAKFLLKRMNIVKQHDRKMLLPFLFK